MKVYAVYVNACESIEYQIRILNGISVSKYILSRKFLIFNSISDSNSSLCLKVVILMNSHYSASTTVPLPENQVTLTFCRLATPPTFCRVSISSSLSLPSSISSSSSSVLSSSKSSTSISAVGSNSPSPVSLSLPVGPVLSFCCYK